MGRTVAIGPPHSFFSQVGVADAPCSLSSLRHETGLSLTSRWWLGRRLGSLDSLCVDESADSANKQGAAARCFICPARPVVSWGVNGPETVRDRRISNSCRSLRARIDFVSDRRFRKCPYLR
jgi:hypothetical protein